jgi:hypothetical protein
MDACERVVILSMGPYLLVKGVGIQLGSLGILLGIPIQVVGWTQLVMRFGCQTSIFENPYNSPNLLTR